MQPAVHPKSTSSVSAFARTAWKLFKPLQEAAAASTTASPRSQKPGYAPSPEKTLTEAETEEALEATGHHPRAPPSPPPLDGAWDGDDGEAAMRPTLLSPPQPRPGERTSGSAAASPATPRSTPRSAGRRRKSVGSADLDASHDQWQCSECGRSFGSASALRDHRRMSQRCQAVRGVVPAVEEEEQ